jgi:hypothetical protein
MTASSTLRDDGAATQTDLGQPPLGQWNDEDFDVLADGAVVGRILKIHAAPVGSPWMWTLAFGHQEDRTPTHGYGHYVAGGSRSQKLWQTDLRPKIAR